MEASLAPMYCPRDQHSLTVRMLEELPVHKCLDCFGLWVPRQVIVSLAKAENFFSLVQLMEAEEFLLASLPKGSLHCPADDTCMHLSSIHRVEMDICPTCRGVWLDRGEFDSAVFRERIGWTETEKPTDNYLKLFFDTIAASAESTGSPRAIARGLLLMLLRIK